MSRAMRANDASRRASSGSSFAEALVGRSGMKDVQGKVAFITGEASGIGLAIAGEFV
jgi:hypothetical protein